MKSKAREMFELNESDNTVLDVKNLERAAIQRDQNWDKEETAYIFNDGSALIFESGPYITIRIEDDYGLSNEYEQLEGYPR